MAKKRKSAMPTVDKSRCDNCQKVTSDEDLNSVNDIYERVDPGGVMPSGECPHCGCLAYPIVRKKTRRCVAIQDADSGKIVGVYLIPYWMTDHQARDYVVLTGNQIDAVTKPPNTWDGSELRKPLTTAGFEYVRCLPIPSRSP